MHPVEFQWREGELWIEDLPVRELARVYGTPLYVYSRAVLERNYRAVAQAFAEVSPSIHYAVKANGNLAIVRVFARLGAGADIVSGGELARVLRAGIPAGRVVFAGVGKTAAEIEEAIRVGVQAFTVESEPELERIAQMAEQLGHRARVMIRVNPDVDPRTHVHTTTGKRENKFGVDLEHANATLAWAVRRRALEVVGLHMHLGSPLESDEPYRSALEKVAPLFERWREKCETFRIMDIGGGFGIPYRPKDPEFPLATLGRYVADWCRKMRCRLAIEPGRFLVGNAGVLVATVQYVKDNSVRRFVIVDAGMNDLIRPPLYGAWHDIRPVSPRKGTHWHVDVVGPICESGDTLGKDRHLPPVEPGDLLAIFCAGAYGMAMASNYNARPRAAEVLVDGSHHYCIRERETIEDLMCRERIPDVLRDDPPTVSAVQ
jgi:diaminopimelate decarboxylase